MPFSLSDISLTHQARVLTHLDEFGIWAPTTPAVAMIVVVAVWTAIGLLKIRRLET